MKRKVSISMDEEVLNEIQIKLKEGLFRNKSHLVEYATKKLLEKR
jgi:Arc/MetJ-type ribon-helix-helix transcriptional regulator